MMHSRHLSAAGRLLAAGLTLSALLSVSACGPAEAEGRPGEALEAGPVQRFALVIEDTSPSHALLASGAFATPVGMEQRGPISPGSSYAVLARADPGDRLSFATSFVQGNDLFLASFPDGIALHDEAGAPRDADVTGEVRLWDAGTEQNEAPGAGAHQAPRQAGPDDGAPDRDGRVREVGGDGFVYPAVAEMLRVHVSPAAPGWVLITIENVAEAGSIIRPDGEARNLLLSPGAWAVHGAGVRPLFAAGAPASPELEALAEQGEPGALAGALAVATGERLGRSPGAWAVHRGGSPMVPDENTYAPVVRLAASGDAGPLGQAVHGAPGVQASGLLSAGSDDRQATIIEARPGDRLSLLSRYGATGLLLATGPAGTPLFDPMGVPIEAELTANLRLYLPVDGAPDLLRPIDPEQSSPPLASSLRVSLRPVR
jgi:hypothetical protein